MLCEFHLFVRSFHSFIHPFVRYGTRQTLFRIVIFLRRIDTDTDTHQHSMALRIDVIMMMANDIDVVDYFRWQTKNNNKNQWQLTNVEEEEEVDVEVEENEEKIGWKKVPKRKSTKCDRRPNNNKNFCVEEHSRQPLYSISADSLRLETTNVAVVAPAASPLYQTQRKKRRMRANWVQSVLRSDNAERIACCRTSIISSERRWIFVVLAHLMRSHLFYVFLLIFRRW